MHKDRARPQRDGSIDLPPEAYMGGAASSRRVHLAAQIPSPSRRSSPTTTRPMSSGPRCYGHLRAVGSSAPPMPRPTQRAPPAPGARRLGAPPPTIASMPQSGSPCAIFPNGMRVATPGPTWRTRLGRVQGSSPKSMASRAQRAETGIHGGILDTPPDAPSLFFHVSGYAEGRARAESAAPVGL